MNKIDVKFEQVPNMACWDDRFVPGKIFGRRQWVASSPKCWLGSFWASLETGKPSLPQAPAQEWVESDWDI